MAEAFAALSIAANIAQFIGYAKQLISSGREIYSSVDGSQGDHKALKVIVEDIKSLSDATQEGESSTDDKELRKLAAECEPVADKLLGILKDLEVPNDARFRGLKSIRQTFRSVTKKKTIQELEQRLASIDDRLRDRASTILHKRNHSNIASAIESLTREHQRLEINSEFQLEKLQANIVRTLDEQHNDATKSYTGLESLAKQLFVLAEQGRKVALEQKLLESLLFQEMEQREEAIKDAHAETLGWMFEEAESRLTSWLEAGSGIYWVKGKAGSGKSTLMKHIYNHEATLDALRNWAGSQKLFVARFFFWNSGFPKQKSQLGLLQSLLYQVLRACPDLIAQVYSHKSPTDTWTRQKLFGALRKVSEQTILPGKFCFFIDGLDEYEGDDEEIIALLRDFTSSANVKICISSRPWNAFLDAFDSSESKLVLEDLTRNDMQKYVHNMLIENEIYAQLAKSDPRCTTLEPQIAKKAQGVWLWVYLVVRDLLRDLRGAEDFPLLQRRLDSFPDELESYFASMIDRIDKIHREETARIFLVNLAAVVPIPIFSLKYLIAEVTDPEYTFKLKISDVPDLDANYLKWKLTKLLNSRCSDLLEVQKTTTRNAVSYLDWKIGFLHRTVKDFLRNNFEGELRSRTGVGFEARTSLCNAIIALSKESLGSPLHAHYYHPSLTFPYLQMVEEFLYYVRDFERTEGRALVRQMDEFYQVNSQKFEGYEWMNLTGRESSRGDNHDKYDWSIIPGGMRHTYIVYTFLGLAIQVGLCQYVKEKLQSNRDLISQPSERPLLDYALRRERASPLLAQHSKTVLAPHMVRLLLGFGPDPNQPMAMYDGSTVWSMFLMHCCWIYRDSSVFKSKTPRRFIREQMHEIFELMIDHGADPSVVIPLDFVLGLEQETVGQILENIFEEDDGRAARLILRMEAASLRKESYASRFWGLLGWN